MRASPSSALLSELDGAVFSRLLVSVAVVASTSVAWSWSELSESDMGGVEVVLEVSWVRVAFDQGDRERGRCCVLGYGTQWS